MAIKVQGDVVIYDNKVFKVGSGPSEQRPESPIVGMIRYNTDLNTFEGFSNGKWGSIGRGATGGENDGIFWENDQTITADYTITAGKNAGTFGPITLSAGVTVTVPNGSVWAVI